MQLSIRKKIHQISKFFRGNLGFVLKRWRSYPILRYCIKHHLKNFHNFVWDQISCLAQDIWQYIFFDCAIQDSSSIQIGIQLFWELYPDRIPKIFNSNLFLVYWKKDTLMNSVGFLSMASVDRKVRYLPNANEHLKYDDRVDDCYLWLARCCQLQFSWCWRGRLQYWQLSIFGSPVWQSLEKSK